MHGLKKTTAPITLSILTFEQTCHELRPLNPAIFHGIQTYPSALLHIRRLHPHFPHLQTPRTRWHRITNRRRHIFFLGSHSQARDSAEKCADGIRWSNPTGNSIARIYVCARFSRSSSRPTLYAVYLFPLDMIQFVVTSANNMSQLSAWPLFSLSLSLFLSYM